MGIVIGFYVAQGPDLEMVKSLTQANNNDSLRVVVAYHRLHVPMRGDSVHFQPLEHVSPITFNRWNGEVDFKNCKTDLEKAEVITLST